MYNINYFINKFEAIPEEKWCVRVQDDGFRAGGNHSLHVFRRKFPIRSIQPYIYRNAVHRRQRVGMVSVKRFEEDDLIAQEPAAYADACVALLSPAGMKHRGKIWSIVRSIDSALPMLDARPS